jgi:DNA repair exonuclease SbcCD ATPase subunit
MISDASLSIVIGFVPLAMEHWILLVLLLCSGVGGAWFLQEKKIKRLDEASALQSEQQLKAHADTVKSLSEVAAAEVSVLKLQLSEAVANYNVLEERQNLLREAAQRREDEATVRIETLVSELASFREIAAQLEPTRARIGDLEAALSSERGRLSAMEQTVFVSSKRADDFQQRLDQSHRDLTQHRQQAEQREREQQAEITRLEQTLKVNAFTVETAERQISQAGETLESYRQQSETRITNLQRQLTASEAKAALVQKEFMSAVGVLPDKPVLTGRMALAVDDKRITDLEAKLHLVEAESRKKAREDGYKIAELEYRLSEALDQVKE